MDLPTPMTSQSIYRLRSAHRHTKVKT